MTLETKLTHPSEYLESFRPPWPSDAWQFVAMGLWSESPYHSGESLYEIIKNEELNTWVVVSSNQIDPHEGEDDEDGEDGVNDEQIQSVGENSDETPEESVIPEVIAICRDAPQDATIEEMAKDMYDELWDIGLGLDE